MSSLENSDNIQLIKDRLDIADVIGDYIELKREGQIFKGLCPFHSDKNTPSFTVYPDSQRFVCFGCDAKGDVIDFVREYNNVDLPTALEILARRAGVELIPYDGFNEQKSKLKNGLYDVMSFAKEYYEGNLMSRGGAAGREYLLKRGISVDDAKKFGLGWAGTSGMGLYYYLNGKGISDELCLASGLCKKWDGGIRDRFQGRVMFPVRNFFGQVIAFSGRLVVGDNEAKYINVPETEIFQKRKNLYLLNKAREAIQKKKSVILVEGQMDAVRLHLKGYDNAVASLGTALTKEQVSLIKRSANMCYICYDGDNAGREATVKGMYLLQEQGVDVGVVELPMGQDPDEVLAGDNGVEVFDKALEKAAPLVLFHLNCVRDRLKQRSERGQAVKELFNGLIRLSRPEIALFAADIACDLGLSVESFWYEFNEFKGSGGYQDVWCGAFVEPDESKQPKSYDSIESAFCALMRYFPNNEKVRLVAPLVRDPTITLVCHMLMTTPFEVLKRQWESMNDAKPMEIIAYGDSVLTELKDSVRGSVLAFVCDVLRERKRTVDVRNIEERMKSGDITKEDLKRLAGVS